MSSSRSALVGACAVLLLSAGSLAVGQSRDAPIPHDTGQSVTPSFEGWYPNPDGTFSLSFGYMNRNFEDTQDIPIGADNRFAPGPEDRGQPTHFLSRRQTGVFTVVVPADFGEQQLTWTLTRADRTITIPGHLRPEWKIDALHEITSGNSPPRLRFGPDDEGGSGPRGPSTSITTTPATATTLSVWASDDGVKKRASPRPPVLGLVWTKYRGPGAVSFSSPRPTPDDAGHAVTDATFTTPGDYTLRVLAWDDSGPPGAIMAGGFQCCWTNGYVHVTVRSQ
jgi:hypothetical protein